MMLFRPVAKSTNARSDQTGLSLAAGFVDFATGRNSIITAPGPGSTAEVKVFAFPLLVATGAGSRHGKEGGPHMSGIGQPWNTATFMPFGKDTRAVFRSGQAGWPAHLGR